MRTRNDGAGRKVARTIDSFLGGILRLEKPDPVRVINVVVNSSRVVLRVLRWWHTAGLTVKGRCEFG